MGLMYMTSSTQEIVEATFNVIFAITTIYAMIAYYRYKQKDQEGDL